MDDARDANAEAVAVAEANVQRRSDNNAQHFLARALLDQGRTLLLRPGGGPQAEESVSRAVAIWEDLQTRYPQYVTLYSEWHALGCAARGEVRAAAGPAGPAEADFQKARSTLERLAEKLPDVPSYRGDLGRTYAALGRLWLARGDAVKAKDFFEKAVAALGRAAEASPEDAQFRRWLDEARAELSRLNAGAAAGRGGL